MPVILVHQGAGLTQQSYDDAVARVTGGKEPPESQSTGPSKASWFTLPAKARMASASSTSGSRKKRLVAFEKLVPILQELGIQAEPEMYPAHTFVSA